MISNQDVAEYLQQIMDMENAMESKYAKLAKNVNDEDMENVLRDLMRDEKGHAEMVSTLMDMFSQEK